jgi:hypothetical protein
MRRLLVMCAVLLSCASSLKAQTALCESFGKAYRECRIASSGTVQLVMEISERLCFESLTWGTSTPGTVWVKNNCRATFTVTNTGIQPLRGRNLLVCESTKGNREICTADASSGVLLTRQLSKAPCVQGESWGADPERDLIWVDYGCRAEFLLGRTNEVEVAPPYLDSVVVCESEDGRRRNCTADTTAGVQIVRQLSDKACGFGHEWGYDGKGIWVTKGCRAEFVVRGKPKPLMRAIVCASENDARKQCPAETQFGVALMRQISERECILGKSWGFDETGVWVADGCHGQFALGGYRLTPEAMPLTASKITCESLDGGHKHCPVDTSHGVGLIRQISDSDCVLNRTWAYDRNGIWVTNGCRAEFAVAH